MSKKISMTKLLTAVLRKHGKSKKEATEISDAFNSTITSHLMDAEGELTIGKLGKLTLRSYPAAERYNPAKRAKEMSPAYKALRFKAFKAARR